MLRGDLHVQLQGPVQDVLHDLGLDKGVVLGEVSVQLLDLVLQVLYLHLQEAWGDFRSGADNCILVSWYGKARALPSPCRVLIVMAVLCEGGVLALGQQHLGADGSVQHGFLDGGP
jgi:hypothetical protein